MDRASNRDAAAFDGLCDRRVAELVGRTSFAYVAIETRRGPHVTPVLYGVAGGTLWFAVPRGTLKARAMRRRPRCGVLLRAEDRSVVLGGEVTLLDPLRPTALARTLPKAALAPLAAGSYSLRNAQELFGFAIDAPRVPPGSMPWNVLLAAFEPDRIAFVDGDAVEPHGEWPGGGRPPAHRDLAPGPPPRSPKLPEAVAELLERSREGVVGLTSADGTYALPAEWDAASWTAQVPAAALALIGAEGEAPACLTLDASDAKRPTAKRGLMVRGIAEITGEGPTGRVAVAPERVTYWLGFETRTVDA